ncbi:unnamed protein product [Linum tenue]|uniref:Uncharacterized protein n=1 Tax=Linum tenue TaxID=586396 RepID=A0AAV0LY64_9ROSI|nr:unnamed protein product [Linum tenue]
MTGAIEKESLSSLLILEINIRRSRSIRREDHNSIHPKSIPLQHRQCVKKPIPLNSSPLHLVARQQLTLPKLLRPHPKRAQVTHRALHLVRVKLVVHIVNQPAVLPKQSQIRRHGGVERRDRGDGDRILPLQPRDELADAVGEAVVVVGLAPAERLVVDVDAVEVVGGDEGL